MAVPIAVVMDDDRAAVTHDDLGHRRNRDGQRKRAGGRR